MVREPVTVGIAVAPELGDDDERRAIAVAGQRLRVLPQLVHQSIGPPDGVEIQ